VAELAEDSAAAAVIVLGPDDRSACGCGIEPTVSRAVDGKLSINPVATEYPTHSASYIAASDIRLEFAQ